MGRQCLGEAGERAAARWLEEAGWHVLARNWRCRQGELDIVALDGDVLVAVEVKVRRDAGNEPAEWAVTPRKGRRLLAALSAFLGAHPEHQERLCRVDLIAITVDRGGRIVRWSHLLGCVSEGDGA